MTKENYSEEFRRDAVELYRDTDGATGAGIAADLGISHGSLTTWLKNAGIPTRISVPPPRRGPPRRDTATSNRPAPGRGRTPANGENQA
ncbi:transposase [Rhodococcus sp. 24CO]|uniref:transposase n=1 Tax=Rhodococcus sp. 24CO TaxID=3117460 RepID=UPI003D33329B